jgi:hypothetical protein
MDTAPDGADRDRDRLGNLLVGEPDDVTEHHRFPELDRELEQGLLDIVADGDACVLGVGRRSAGQIPTIDFIRQWGGGTPISATDVIEECVTGDPPQPTFEASRLIGGKTLADPKQHLLDQI